MAEFLFRTKHASDPKGKPRVYFTCCPGDFSAHFEKLSVDILSIQDCAIYYKEDMSARIEEGDRAATLEQMNLFVVPVTRALLTTDCPAREEIRYANGAHIPVLPFMMESGLDKLYGESDLFQDHQYLDPYDSDPTAVKYPDKLAAYLQAVLISDELAQRVRAAFDAYIFLSYRKKDRGCANRLMRLIHSVPRFRDMAIWFDEFLTPGESFRENIARALHSSDLFALVVTPSLLEDRNYVAETEYPMAQEAEKCIFPAEMEATDKAALAEKFAGLPECVDPNDPDGFSRRLLDAFMKLATTRHEEEPEHNFLIGLAYLEGIDVEVNRERGLELITMAAEAGLPEAMEKLFRLYSGEEKRAFRSVEKAIFWGERIVEQTADTCGPEHHNTLVAKAKLAAVYSADGRFEEAKALLEEIYRIRSRQLGQTHELTLTALHNLVVEYTNLRDYPEAVRLGEKVYALRCRLLGETHPDTIITLHNLGVAYQAVNDARTGIALLEKAHRLSEEALGSTHPHTLQIRDSLTDAYVSSGDDAGALGLLDQLILRQVKDHGPKSGAVQAVISRIDYYGYAACAGDDPDKAALYWGKAYDCRYYYFGLQGYQTESTLDSLTELLPEVGAPQREQILDRLGAALWKLRELVWSGAYDGTTTEGLRRMFKLLKIYRRHGTPQKRVEFLEMYYDLCVELCGEAAPVIERLTRMLVEDRGLLFSEEE